MSDTKTMKAWAHLLSAPDAQLTLEEARTLAQIAGTDRLLECLTALTDVQSRLTRMELFIAETFPAYEPRVAQRTKSLTNGKAAH